MTAVVVLILRLLMAVALYAFVGFAFYLLWKNLRKPGGSSQESIPILFLKAADDEVGETLRFNGTQVIVGREKSCQLCLKDEAISARHARLSYHNNQWWVEDLGSTNGTFLNLLPVTTPTVLVSGDTLTFGKISLIIGFE